MADVKTNFTTLQVARETALNTPATVWKQLEPNTIPRMGAEVTTVARRPISKDRMTQKGTVTDLDSGVEFEADLTFETSRDFLEGFVFATYDGPAAFGPLETNDVTAVTATGYTVGAGGALATDTLIFARGFTNSANNGLKAVTAGSTATEIKASGLVVEASPPTNAEVAVAGVVGASGDITMNASGNLTSTVLNFTTLGLTVGQFIWVGGTAAANQFATAAYRGFARVAAIAANLLTLEKRAWTVGAADNGAGKTIHLYFGRFLRNVAVDSADFVERSFHFEAAWHDLVAVGTDGYEYAKGNYSNELVWNLPRADKVTMVYRFVGTDTEVPTSVRKTGASTPILPVDRTAYNTSADILRIRITELDEDGLTTYFDNATLTIRNSVTPKKVLGLLGALSLNVGNLDVVLDGQALFSDPDVISAIRNNTSVTMEFALRNENGALLVDIPEMTMGNGGKELPVNETVLLSLTGTAHQAAVLGTAISISQFPYAPAS